MANNNAMDSLKKGAIRVYNGMIAVWPQFSSEEPLNISELTPKFNGCYATNNSTVIFISDNEVFVAPYTRNLMCSLHSAGFCEKHFYVPFSNGDYPKFEQFKWNNLRMKAEQVRRDNFVKDCNEFADKHHIGAISDETLSRCFKMPIEGVRVKHPYFEDTYYPVLANCCLDYTAADKIGKFCYNNGRVVFVYRDGMTYVAKGYSIVDELSAAGYSKSGLFVPFSNGEKIMDYALAARWDSIRK